MTARPVLWVLLPLALLIAVGAAFLAADPLRTFRTSAPPVEELTVERAVLVDTPQIEEPTASRLVSFGESLNARPSQVISTIDIVNSSATATRLMPPSLSTSPTRKRTPSSTMPSLRKNS